MLELNARDVGVLVSRRRCHGQTDTRRVRSTGGPDMACDGLLVLGRAGSSDLEYGVTDRPPSPRNVGLGDCQLLLLAFGVLGYELTMRCDPGLDFLDQPHLVTRQQR